MSSKISFAGVDPSNNDPTVISPTAPTSNTNNNGEAPEGVAPKPRATLQSMDWGRVDTSSTYTALSSCVRLLQVSTGGRQVEFWTHAELDQLVDILERDQVDLSNYQGFPYDAEDLDQVLELLARLQNRLSKPGDVLHRTCTLQDIMEDALLDRTKKSHRYDIGDWVEVLGPSMKYRLEMIVDVVRTTVEQSEGEQFLYETLVDHKLTEMQIRWPREALRRIFGMGPWVWRQWACVKLEHKLRFQEGHPDDLELLDVQAYAMELWRLWLNDPRNTEFRQLFDRVGEAGQAELLHHIMSPFRMIHEVVTNHNGRWDLDDANISIFTYVSLLGSGFLHAAVVFALQVSMPVTLFFFYTSPDREEDYIAVGTREMLLAVLLFYLYKLNRGRDAINHASKSCAFSLISLLSP